MGKYGLLGERLGHSFSPEIHRLLGGYDYSLLEVPREALGDFLARRPFDGINVTIPYKQAVIPYLDGLSDIARRIGSVNTVIRAADGRLLGENTDYSGFLQMVRHAGIEVKNRKCLVLGSGGASRTVCVCLEDLGAAEVRVISRSGPDHYGNLERHADARVIVNATPVGMYPGNGQAPVRLSAFPALEGVLDLIYNPARTALLLEAERRGIPCANGLYMLVSQARQAAEIFLGKTIPEEETRRVVGQLAWQTANIVLIGMPGCGKTTVGKLLAKRLNRPLVDTDALVEEKTAGLSCGEYLRRYGEAAFRQLETAAIREAGKRTGAVIATGGGAVTRPENLDALRQNGVIFHLDRPVEQLSRRGDRPLSATEEALRQLFARRAPMYAAFRDERIDNTRAEDAVREIGQRFAARLKGETP